MSAGSSNPIPVVPSDAMTEHAEGLAMGPPCLRVVIPANQSRESEEAGAVGTSMRMPPTCASMSAAMSYAVPMGDDIPPPKADFSAPPPYDVATKLPTYDEVQREKHRQGELPISGPSQRPPTMPMFLAIDADPSPEEGDTSLLGTDFMFFTAFIVAFLFNWIGFLLLLCFCHTIAARYGALSGFGLSLAKWTLIVKHSTDLASRDNNWLWWLIMTFGLLICIRAVIQYLNIKKGWRLLSGNAQERLMLFY